MSARKCQMAIGPTRATPHHRVSADTAGPRQRGSTLSLQHSFITSLSCCPHAGLPHPQRVRRGKGNFYSLLLSFWTHKEVKQHWLTLVKFFPSIMYEYFSFNGFFHSCHFGGGHMILWPPPFGLWGGPWPGGPPSGYASGLIQSSHVP